MEDFKMTTTSSTNEKLPNYQDMAGRFLMPHKYYLVLHFWCKQVSMHFIRMLQLIPPVKMLFFHSMPHVQSLLPLAVWSSPSLINDGPPPPSPSSLSWGWLYGMEMDLYKSWISDGVLVQKWNRMSRCLKLHASVSQFFGTKRTHSHVPGLKGEALFSKLLSFFAVCRL